ncbi:SDR family NAD(P)-dependent oxidoreductase [Sandarakinorhabdus rubra]|uniref:SDR family NAD(P)-dependent oxidoreductase n=1 Tax=Sandarakinorhabdus rubra TaxID=2672568 RepID=UPI0013D9ECBC|nr:SDR family NAD(P)-dependent oxidoreductase [Sandarakinorhabdus rubra]
MARILVTGARRGIGREITLTLARAGHEVIATMRDTSGSDLADIAAREGMSISLAALDVDDDASVAALFARPGMASVDVLINNAGILSINAMEDESMAMIKAVMNTNFFGPVRCMKAVLPAMRERGDGLIINISSIAGRMAVFADSGYCASKFALEAASEVAAQELAPFGVRVALVEPGIIATDMAVANLPQPRADSAYPSGRRMVALNADAGNATPPSVVAGAVLDIVSGRNTAFRTPCGDDAAMFLGMRARMTDEAWIGMSDTLDDSEFFARMTAAGQG